MESSHTYQDLRRAKLSRNGFFILAVLLCLISLYQQVNFSRAIGTDRTILKSQFIGDNCAAWVNDFAASKCYLEGLAFGDIVTLMNLHPSNGKLVQDRMLARTHSSFKNNMKKWIFEQVTLIRNQQYSFSFYVSDVIADEKTKLVFVKGTLNPKIGTTDLDPEEVTWALRYQIVNGEALIADFYEHKPKGKR
ncbi:TraE/TraK family type IV conjugative transfer system protein [Vibrio vulnificus]|uniref:TraE/TraK family type IV conjugative transfer system protein n=1 Tax=Vibrio vulnificus TaxID=672 RepID=UPI0032EAB1DE